MAQPVRILITRIIATIIIIAIAAESDGHELRPSDHGLDFQDSPSSSQAKTSHEMKSFFGGVGSPKGSSPSSGVALPKAMNSTDASWWSAAGRSGGGGGARDNVRRVMLWASVGCGITGVALLLASGFLYILWRKKQRQQQPSSSAASISSPPPQQPFFDK